MGNYPRKSEKGKINTRDQLVLYLLDIFYRTQTHKAIYTHIYIHTHIHDDMYTHIYAHIHTHTYTHTYTHTHIFVVVVL